MLLFIIFFLAFWAGFSVRRGSLCLVRATHEIVERKPPKTLFFVMEAMAVALSITIPAMIFFQEHISLSSSYKVSWILFLGTGLYGVGAALNGACALGTLNQLMNGKFDYLGTILGIATGFFLFLFMPLTLSFDNKRNQISILHSIWFLLPLLVVVWSIVFFQAKMFLKQSEEQKKYKLKQYLTSPVARDFIGVSIFGFCSGMIYLLLGKSWDYTKFIMDVEKSLYIGDFSIVGILPVFITTLSLLLGMGLATKLSKTFQSHSFSPKHFTLRFMFGVLMGLAVGFVPGGNDTLILYGLPGLALHALVGLSFMMFVIGVVISSKKLILSYNTA